LANGAFSSLVHIATSAAAENVALDIADGVPVVIVSAVPNFSIRSFVPIAMTAPSID
jgi:hypothetical protein